MRRIARGRFLIAFLAVLAASLPVTPAEAQSAATEYQVKAAYLLNFARFVQWPSEALAPAAPLAIAVVGDDSFSRALVEALHGKTANGHAIHARQLRWNDILTSYQIVFISLSEEDHLAQILRFLETGTVLTVSDIDRFSLRGGVIEFRMVGNRVRFDINRSSPNASRLNISSKLLSVARAVHEGGAR